MWVPREGVSWDIRHDFTESILSRQFFTAACYFAESKGAAMGRWSSIIEIMGPWSWSILLKKKKKSFADYHMHIFCSRWELCVVCVERVLWVSTIGEFFCCVSKCLSSVPVKCFVWFLSALEISLSPLLKNNNNNNNKRRNERTNGGRTNEQTNKKETKPNRNKTNL